MNIPKELLYTKTHEWVKKNEDGTVYIGLTDFAQSELGDLVFALDCVNYRVVLIDVLDCSVLFGRHRRGNPAVKFLSGHSLPPAWPQESSL